MIVPSTQKPGDLTRHLLFVTTPALWPAYPFLPVVRRRPGEEEEYGLLFDFFGTGGRTGLSSAVFFCNLFALPRTLDASDFSPNVLQRALRGQAGGIPF